MKNDNQKKAQWILTEWLKDTEFSVNDQYINYPGIKPEPGKVSGCRIRQYWGDGDKLLICADSWGMPHKKIDNREDLLHYLRTT